MDEVNLRKILNKLLVQHIILDSINQKLPALRLGIIEFRAKIADANQEFIALVDSYCKELRNDLASEDITKIPAINNARKGYKLCGKDPSRYRPSADSLIRRIIKGNDLYRINNVVDALNLVSMQTGISIGGYDLDKIQGQISMDVGTAEDVYHGIGRGLLNIEGLPVLRDELGVFGSPTSDSERTMITKKSKHIAFVFFDFGKSNTLEGAIKTLQTYLVNYCSVKLMDSWLICSDDE